MKLMVLLVKPNLTRFPTRIHYIPVDSKCVLSLALAVVGFVKAYRQKHNRSRRVPGYFT